MAVYDTGNGVSGAAHVFVSSVLNGVVARFDITYSAAGLNQVVTMIANGMNHRTDPAALVLGPSGLAYDPTHDKLYIANSGDNAIYEIAGAAAAAGPVTPTLFFQDVTHLHGPLNMSILPNGHLVVADSDGSNADPNQPSELVEFSATGSVFGADAGGREQRRRIRLRGEQRGLGNHPPGRGGR